MRSAILPFATLTLLGTLLGSSLPAAATDLLASRQTGASKAARAGEPRFRDLYKELVEIDTTLSAGSCTRAVDVRPGDRVSARFDGLGAVDVDFE